MKCSTGEPGNVLNECESKAYSTGFKEIQMRYVEQNVVHIKLKKVRGKITVSYTLLEPNAKTSKYMRESINKYKVDCMSEGELIEYLIVGTHPNNSNDNSSTQELGKELANQMILKYDLDPEIYKIIPNWARYQ